MCCTCCVVRWDVKASAVNDCLFSMLRNLGGPYCSKFFFVIMLSFLVQRGRGVC